MAKVERTRAAVERICRWMNDHGAPLLVENLAAGATESELAEAEQKLGHALPEGLRALWSLHNGQDGEHNGFIEWYDFLSIDWSVAQHESVMACIEFARENPTTWGAELTAEELQSEHWFPFAGRDSDSLAVGVTGRVFRFDHDDSPKLIAHSFAEWLDGYAERVEADDYEVDEGFGDYYLVLRDRERERAEAERAARRQAHEQYRRETPLDEQLRVALEANDEDRCMEVLQDARDREGGRALPEIVTQLFASKPDPKLVAGALRPLLNAVTLTSDQWESSRAAASCSGTTRSATSRGRMSAHRRHPRPARDRAGWSGSLESGRPRPDRASEHLSLPVFDTVARWPYPIGTAS